MRTALFISALLAAVNLSFSASAVELAPAQLQFDSELAQVGADKWAGWAWDENGDKKPETVSAVLKIFEMGVADEGERKRLLPYIFEICNRHGGNDYGHEFHIIKDAEDWRWEAKKIIVRRNDMQDPGYKGDPMILKHQIANVVVNLATERGRKIFDQFLKEGGTGKVHNR